MSPDNFLVCVGYICPDLDRIELRFASGMSKSGSNTPQNLLSTKSHLFGVNITYNLRTKKSVMLHRWGKGGPGGVTPITDSQ